MANEIVAQSNELAKPTNELVELEKKLRDNGYYENVKTPQEYLKTLKNDTGTGESDSGDDLELSDDSSTDIQEAQETPLQRADRYVESPKPLQHWNYHIQSKFDECSVEQKKAWLDSFKIVEKGFVKQINSLKDDLAMADPVFQLLLPHTEYFKQTGETPAGYFKKLMDFDQLLGVDPATAVARLIVAYNLSVQDIGSRVGPVAQDMQDSTKINQAIAPYVQEVNELKNALGYTQEEQVSSQEVEAQADDYANQVEAFFDQRDAQGNLLYPSAYDYIDDIMELVQTGSNLDEAYRKVVGSGYEEPVYDDDDDDEDIDEEVVPAATLSGAMTSRDQEKQFLKNQMNKIKRGY